MERVTTILAVIAAVLIGCIILFIAGKTLGIVDLEPKVLFVIVLFYCLLLLC